MGEGGTMKTLESIASGTLPPVSDGKIVEMIAVLGGWRKLDNPILSTDLQCVICSNKEHYTPFIDPLKDTRRIWICANGDCVTNNRKNLMMATTTPLKSQRALLWPKFCELNGIGDINHDVKFEDIKQSDGKISYLLKFVSTPRGIIFMQGDPGMGKTFAALGVCEMFTRKDMSCIFTTQKQMAINWLETFKQERGSLNNYIERLMTKSLLVIDDFGTSEIPPGFMSFFMDLINTRMQWTNRGTIITSNLDIKKFNAFCGEALADRIMTGQHFEFKGKTRRQKTIL